MVTAALWYKSASGRGDAPESNTVSSSELITQREGERGTPREKRGCIMFNVQSVLKEYGGFTGLLENLVTTDNMDTKTHPLISSSTD